MAKTEKGHGNR